MKLAITLISLFCASISLAAPSLEQILAANVSSQMRHGAMEGTGKSCAIQGYENYHGYRFYLGGNMTFPSSHPVWLAALKDEYRQYWQLDSALNLARFAYSGYEVVLRYNPTNLVVTDVLLNWQTIGSGRCVFR